MVLFPKLFGQPGPNPASGRKMNVSDRLDQYVVTVARKTDRPLEPAYVIDRNYEIVYTVPAPRK